MSRKDIREFDSFREVLEHIYKYGFYSREDFIGQNIVTPRVYDNIIRQLRDLYFLDVLDETKPILEDISMKGKRKCYRFLRDPFGDNGQDLLAPYGLFAVRDQVIFRLIICLALVACLGKATVSQIDDIIQQLDPQEDFQKEDTKSNKNNFVPDSVRRDLDDLVKVGYLTKKEKVYTLSNPFHSLGDDTLVRLYYLSSYYAGAGFPRVAAAFLCKTLRRHILSRNLPDPPIAFIFNDVPAGNVLDEPVVFRLLEACKEHRKVSLVLIKNQTERKVQPVVLRVDIRLGRWYLLAMQEDDTPAIMRVSNLKKVKILDDVFDYHIAFTKVMEAFQYSFLSGKPREEPVVVEAELHFQDVDLQKQFEREIRIGSIVNRDGKEIYRVKINDPIELKPFLRRYGDYLRILPGEGHSLDVELRDEYERMLSHYGTVQ